MIVNYPTVDDYKKIAIECLLQSFDLIYTTDKQISTENYIEANLLNTIDPTAISDLSDPTIIAIKQQAHSAIWGHKQQALRTAIILIHQSIEYFTG